MAIRQALKIKKAQKAYRKEKRAKKAQRNAGTYISTPINLPQIKNKKSNKTVYIVGGLLVGSILIAYLVKLNKR
jgi:hypothetical protein